MEEQLAELRIKLAEAEARAEEEQRRREKEQQKSKQAEARAAEEQRRREEEQRRREEEQRRREEEQRRREEEQRRREEAEEQSRPKGLVEYLEACHGFSLALKVVTDATLTTQGDTTKPTGRPFPQRIVPWDDFPTSQEKIWKRLSTSTRFNSQPVYPSAHQLEYVQRYLDPISSELGLRHYARETVENPVRTLIEEIYKDEQLRLRLGLRGTMTFESHTNLGQQSETAVEEAMENMSLTGSSASKSGVVGGKKADKRGLQGNTGGTGRKAAGTADQFCIYQLSNGQRIPVVSIEYKPPHKLPLAQIIAGLKGEIQPADEVINKDGDDFDFRSKCLVAAVITQLFSYMIRKGIQWGYVFVGEAIIFLYIPDDPTTVRYHLSIPRLDFQEGDENKFHRTSVAQISAFVLSALACEAPSQSWHDAAANLDTWDVEYIDILKNIPETERKAPREISYKAGRWKGFTGSPIRTRSRSLADACNKPMDKQVHQSSNESDDDNPPTPTPRRAAAVPPRGSGKPTQPQGARRSQRKKDASHSGAKEAGSTMRIDDRPFCTQQCLLGLACGGDLDSWCPNLQDHQGKHIPPSSFLRLIRTQLANDRGRCADCKPLYIKGSRGALFKVRLSLYGYTLVAKGMRKHDRKHLLHERNMYNDLLHPFQGSYFPVSLGIVDLKLPYHFDSGIYVSMLFLSWSGISLCHCLTPKNEARILDQANKILEVLHKRRVLHKDVEPRNWLWDEQYSRLMLIDFERAEIRERPPLGTLSPNRKRNQQGKLKSEMEADEFNCEMESARISISRCII